MDKELVVRDQLRSCLKHDHDEEELAKFKKKKGVVHKNPHEGPCLKNRHCYNWFKRKECPPDCGVEGCKNREIASGLVTKHLQTRRVGDKGLTLYTTDTIKKGSKVVEYVGWIRPKEDYRKEFLTNPKRHSYGLEIVKEWIIDATTHSSMARYICHSCDPNLEVEYWISDSGFPKAIMVAKEDIKINDELTFDYEFEEFEEASAWECHCGKANCRYPKQKPMVIRDNSKKLSCPVCDKTFSTTFNLDRHLACKHERGVMEFECAVCEKTFNRKDALTRHMECHDKRKSIGYCKKCKKGFLTKDGYQRHQVLHDKNREIIICKKLVNCRPCGKELRTKAGFKQHQDKFHPNDD